MRAALAIGLLGLVSTLQAQVARYGLADRPAARWSLGARPLLEIGGAAGIGPAEFSGIVGATRLTDGTLVIADGESRELRHFAPDGRFLARISRRGRGPGEVSWLSALFNLGDTLIAFEGREAAHVFTSRGWVRTTRRPVFAGHIVQTPQAIMRPDLTVWWARTGDEKAIKATGDSVYVVIVQADSVVRVVAALPLAPTYGVPGGRAIYPLGFAPGAFVAARADRVCVGYASTYAVRCVDERGRTVLAIERQIRAQPVSTRAQVAFRRAESGLRPDGSSRYEGSLRAHRERVAAAARFARQYPAYSQLLFARSGELWVRDYAMEDGLTATRWRTNPTPSRWSVYSSTGAWLAELLLPARFAPAEIGGDYILGVQSDDDDVERVVLWPLRR